MIWLGKGPGQPGPFISFSFSALVMLIFTTSTGLNLYCTSPIIVYPSQIVLKFFLENWHVLTQLVSPRTSIFSRVLLAPGLSLFALVQIYSWTSFLSHSWRVPCYFKFSVSVAFNYS